MSETQTLNTESESVRTHLTLLQGIILRMAENSRSCKVWCITLVAATMVLVARTEEPNHVLIALIPTVLFLVLDAYYLAQERAFRSSHSLFVSKLHSGSLAEKCMYNMASTGMGPRLVFKCLGSVSIWLFYPLLVVTIGLAWWLIFSADSPLPQNGM